MSQRINFHTLAQLVSEKLEREDVAVIENSLRQLFEQISFKLLTEKSVNIYGIGQLTIINGKINFIPDKSLADAVNAPFAMFETVKLNDEVTDAELNTIGYENQEESSVTDVQYDSVPKIEDVNTNETEACVNNEDMVEAVESDTVPEQDITDKSIQTIEEQNEFETAETESDIDTDDDYDTETTSNSNRWIMFFIGLIAGIALGAAACFLYMSSQFNDIINTYIEDTELLQEK